MCAFQWSLWKARLITWPREPDKQSELTNDGIMPRHSGRRWWWAGDNATTSRTHSSKKKGVETRGGGGREREREREEMEERKRDIRRGEEKKGSNLPYFFPSHLVSAATLVSPPPPPTVRPISFRMTADQPILLFRFICRSQTCAVCLRVRFIIIPYCARNPIQ